MYLDARIDVNSDNGRTYGRTDVLTDGRADGRTENRTPLSHPVKEDATKTIPIPQSGYRREVTSSDYVFLRKINHSI